MKVKKKGYKVLGYWLQQMPELTSFYKGEHEEYLYYGLVEESQELTDEIYKWYLKENAPGAEFAVSNLAVRRATYYAQQGAEVPDFEKLQEEAMDVLWYAWALFEKTATVAQMSDLWRFLSFGSLRAYVKTMLEDFDEGEARYQACVELSDMVNSIIYREARRRKRILREMTYIDWSTINDLEILPIEMDFIIRSTYLICGAEGFRANLEKLAGRLDLTLEGAPWNTQ